MLQRLLRQFSGPSGALGHVAGWLMARRNPPLNRWIVELLDVRPDDRVVEVGFGTGLAIALCAARVTNGHVDGVDHSDVMLRQASRRSRDAIRAGRVRLQRGDAAQLPFADASATRALAVNSFQFWESPETALSELARVLSRGGRLILAQRLHDPEAGPFDRKRFGMTDDRLQSLKEKLEQAGFQHVEIQRNEIANESIAALIATR